MQDKEKREQEHRRRGHKECLDFRCDTDDR